MTALFVVSCLWVLAASVVALLPLRYQYAPGIMLLLAAPVLIYLIGRNVGSWAGAAAALAFISMFRKPLRYFARRAMGLSVEVRK
ncbi:DUF2484 family protein [Roseovarius aestuarii]|uniref:UDP-N-acetylmuramate--alanine ligase n=1 Tax=Roseovarius aestuarii TaxID=475083 RepID=A0A1X7BM96_9RHOB|nr:DUF2484 family protein [Roseovarius aestuarii]SMC10409.1 hypothetical protein ROA7745_00216 [Roseovarius aestuarii]